MEILIDGKFSDEEIEQFSKELGQKDIVVKQFFTKTIDLSEVVLEIVKIIFKDFDAISFLRDGLLWTSLSLLVGKTIGWIKSKKSNVKVQSRSELRFKVTSKKEVVVNISHPENPDRWFWEAIENSVTEKLLNKVETEEKISISWDDEHKKIKIIKF